MGHAYNLNTQEAEAGGSRIQGQLVYTETLAKKIIFKRPHNRGDGVIVPIGKMGQLPQEISGFRLMVASNHCRGGGEGSEGTFGAFEENGGLMVMKGRVGGSVFS